MVRKTRKGITCQKWNVNTPHQTKYDDHLRVTKTDQRLSRKKTVYRTFIKQAKERKEWTLLIAFI